MLAGRGDGHGGVFVVVGGVGGGDGGWLMVDGVAVVGMFYCSVDVDGGCDVIDGGDTCC